MNHRDQLPGSIRRDLWLRYLQVSGEPDRRLSEQMDEAEGMLLDTAQVRGIYRVLPVDALPAEGDSIRRHLEGCTAAAVMAVTIGSGIDALIRRAEIMNVAMAVIVDAGASVLIEQAADAFEQEMIEEIRAGRGPGDDPLYFTPRFSPGYGDYPLRCQREILRCVDAGRKAGIGLTAGDMMTPAKSITAVCGMADRPVAGRPATCGECVLRDKCTLKAAGGRCWMEPQTGTGTNV